MAKWTITAKRADFKAISARFGIDQVTARLIRNRDVIGDDEIEKYLNGDLNDLYAPELLKDCDKASDLIIRKIKEKKPIRIIGDYDIDGVMSTFILTDALSKIGADVDYAIPERIKDGYGINESLIDKAFNDGKDTIITCDNGISAYEQISHAKKLGMTVVVTDHHNVPFDEEDEIIPPSDAVIDQKQKNCHYPNKELCGASVAWKLIILIYKKGGFEPEKAMYYLPFAAFATIGDVVELTGENRIIVKEGLKKLRVIYHYGLSSLMKICNVEPKELKSYHIGFVLGPCLNAGGRLDTAESAMKLMLSKNEYEAMYAAKVLKELNEVRKKMTEDEVEHATRIIESCKIKDDKVIVVYIKDCHESIVGIIAGRIRERYNRPCLVLTDSEGFIKGSGRSTDDYDMFTGLSNVKELLLKFGGHKKAAGVTLEKEKIDDFRIKLNENCNLTDEQIEGKIVLDMKLPFGYISEKLVDELSLLEPFGAGNKKPLFGEIGLNVLSKKLVGKNKNVLQMVLCNEAGKRINAVCFRDAGKMDEYITRKDNIDIAYYPVIDGFNGKKNIKLVITNCR